jgi:hypothetical protein
MKRPARKAGRFIFKKHRRTARPGTSQVNLSFPSRPPAPLLSPGVFPLKPLPVEHLPIAGRAQSARIHIARHALLFSTTRML